MSASPKHGSPDDPNLNKHNLFNFKASTIIPTGTLYSGANSTNNKSINNKSQGFSFLRLDATSSSETFPILGDQPATDPAVSMKEVPSISLADIKPPLLNITEERQTQNEPKIYVFGQKIESRVVIHESDASQSSSQDAKATHQEGVIPSECNKPLISSLPVQKVITGEEGERALVEMSCKLYVFDSSNKTWHSKGRNMLHLNQDIQEDHKSRIICRAYGNQLVLLNSPIWSEMLCELSNANSVKLSANLQEEGIRVVLIQGEKRDVANLYSVLKTRIFNCTLHKEITATSRPPDPGLDEPNRAVTPDHTSSHTPPPREGSEHCPPVKRSLSHRGSSDELLTEENEPPPLSEDREVVEEITCKKSRISDSVSQ